MSTKGISHEAIMIISDKKREVTIFVVMTLLAVILILVFPIRLMALSVIRVNNEIEGKRRIKEQLDTKITNFTQLNTEYQEIRGDLKDFALIFPTQGDYSLFVANVGEICNANYFRLEGIGVSAPRIIGREQGDSYEVLTVWNAHVRVAGRRSDLLRFLEDLEKLPQHPSVTHVSFSNDLTEDGLLNFSIELLLYGVNKPSMYEDI